MASMNAGGAFYALIALALAGTAPTSAHADEAYLCGPDRIVYVSPDNLEEKKRTDPCIAAYFGLQVRPPEAEGSHAAETTRSPIKPSTPAKLKLKPVAAPETAERYSDKPARSAAMTPPLPSPGTDFRNIRVLNAATPDAQWFKHVH